MAEVFLVDRTAFFGGDWPQGFVPFAPDAGEPFLRRAAAVGRFVDRPTAEANPAWKQWIPYCVLRCTGGNGGGGAGVFVVQRTRGQSEGRLHGAWSIGIGGHVEPEDGVDPAGDGSAFFRRALGRELSEELHFRQGDLPPPAFLGLLNDDSTEVGEVHAGLVYRIDLPLPAAEAAERVGIREISKMKGGFTLLVEFFELWQNPKQFETWSQILVRAGIAGATGDCRRSPVGGQDG